MARQITVRGVSDDLVEKLREVAAQRGLSLNALVLELLGHAVGSSERRRRLERYTGSSATDADALDLAIRAQRGIDPSDWR
jgi:plasmid stability protein